MSQIQTGELDLWFPVPGSYFAQLEATRPDLHFLRQRSYVSNHLDFNVASRRLADVSVRRALRLGLDRRTILEKIYHGIGSLQDSPLSVAAPYAVPNVPLSPFDPKQANKLLDRSGWRRAPDGVRQKSGVRLTLDFAMYAGSQDNERLVELIRDNWKQIGVSLNVRHYDPGLLFGPASSGGIVYSGKFDVALFASSLGPFGGLSPLFACSSVPPNGQNDTRWCSKTASAAMEQYNKANDPIERQAFQSMAVGELVRAVPMIVLKVNDDTYVYKPSLKGFHPNQVSQFDDSMKTDL